MSQISNIFVRIENMIKTENNNNFTTSVFNHIMNAESSKEGQEDSFFILNSYVKNIIQEIDLLATEIKSIEGILISVKNQKILRTCFEIIASIGISPCLLPGLGISLSKRCSSAQFLSVPLMLSDEQKYEILTTCTEFLYRSYEIPALKNIIITFHLIDFLAALIQLAFAPLKKPGIYSNFTMTQEMYCKFNTERNKYVQMYEYLVSNCFQPMIMKALLVLQNVGDAKPPLFVQKVIAKEMSRRLTASGGLLSLIRCFIDSPNMDSGLEWKKIEMICKIISTKHGNLNESDYISNITSQLRHIFSINNSKYLATAISCFVSLLKNYSSCAQMKNLLNETFLSLNYNHLLSKSTLPGTIILTSQEVEHNIQILHACTYITQLNIPPELLTPNLYVLFLLRLKCSKDVIKSKITNILLKGFELLNKTETYDLLKQCLFGHDKSNTEDILIEEYEAGLTIKYTNIKTDYPKDHAVLNLVDIIDTTENNNIINRLFEGCLQLLMDISTIRVIKTHTKLLLSLDDDPELLTANDENYAHMLTLLSEISTSPKVVSALQEKPLIVIDFVESLFLKNLDSTNNECRTVALVLLNTILSNVQDTSDLRKNLHQILPKLKKLAEDDSEYQILCKEAISLISSEYPKATVSPMEMAITNIFDSLLPVRAHGIIEINKLIDTADPETISKRHYIFCLLQDQLKDADSYVYLAAINCLASLASHCTSDVLAVLCNEYLNIATKFNATYTKEKQNQAAEIRMKIGDVIVKVTRKLGDIAVVHKTTLLNTMLCASRDEDPLIRASALSNLAEIALVLNYKMGSIIYEVLLCIWGTIESDKAVECRRAAVMVISSLLKGLGKETLVELKENLLPIYRTLNKMYKDSNEDSIVRLHAQIALEELNDIVKGILFMELPMEKEISMLKESNDIKFK